jgi:hypothetical protein
MRQAKTENAKLQQAERIIVDASSVGVEKLLRTKFTKTKLRYDALQTTFLIF